MVSLISSFIIAAVGVVLVFVGTFVLTSSRDVLTVRYQNFRLQMTGRPLKDEDFPRMGRLISSLRIGGFFASLLGLAILVMAFMPR